MNRMIRLLVALIFVIQVSAYAAVIPNGVVYKEPDEDEIVTVHTTLGYCTVLEFPEKPVMVSAGDSTLLKVEVPKNSRNVIIKPLDDKGATNLFVFTQNRRFNYHVVIDDLNKLNYVVDVEAAKSPIKNKGKDVPVQTLLKMARNYNVYTNLGTIKQKKFTQRSLYKECVSEEATVKVIEAFTHHMPNYLIIHVVVQNTSSGALMLNEQNSNVYINKSKFPPDYVIFDSKIVPSMQETDAWFILKGLHASMDNDFSVSLNIQGKEYVFN
ncbi:MAG: TrbG/VirB9 family P-type conjugative transfer protein [Candidatus Omnitrophica bacterium]|nr:TrbG/VirB9 family P-type conjugative transfer protein [Candidatus Omnitrophota bacterium]